MSRLKTVLDWFTPDDEPEQHTVDTEFLREHGGRYKYVTVADTDGDWCRCDLCGQRFDLDEFPQLVDHVAAHGDQVTEDIDPFDEAERQTMITEELLKDVDEWRAENVSEVEA